MSNSSGDLRQKLEAVKKSKKEEKAGKKKPVVPAPEDSDEEEDDDDSDADVNQVRSKFLTPSYLF